MQISGPTSPGTEFVFLWHIIARIESSGQLGALRFEPSLYHQQQPGKLTDLQQAIAAYNRCSESTACMIYSTSWGAAQLMGFNLYALGYEQPISEFLISETSQRLMFASFVAKHGIAYTPAQLASSPVLRDRFAKVYNGSLNYRGVLDASLRHYGFTVK